MRREQAEILLNKLLVAFNWKLPADTHEMYLDRLMTLPFASGTKRVDQLIDNNRFFPKIAELLQPSDEEYIFSNTAGKTRWAETAEARYAVYRQDRLVELDEPTYREYVRDPEIRARLESEWRWAWEQQQMARPVSKKRGSGQDDPDT